MSPSKLSTHFRTSTKSVHNYDQARCVYVCTMMWMMHGQKVRHVTERQQQTALCLMSQQQIEWQIVQHEDFVHCLSHLLACCSFCGSCMLHEGKMYLTNLKLVKLSKQTQHDDQASFSLLGFLCNQTDCQWQNKWEWIEQAMTSKTVAKSDRCQTLPHQTQSTTWDQGKDWI